MSELVLLAFGVATVLATAIATLRRSFRDTSPRHFHRVFETWNLPEKFDDAERIHRLKVVFDFSTQLLRAVWVVLWVTYRIDHAPFYAGNPEAWTDPESPGVAAPGGIAMVSLEILAMSLLFFVLVPQVISTYRGKKLALASLPFFYRLEAVLSPLTIAFRAVYRVLLRVVGNGEERTGADIAEEGIRDAVENAGVEGLLHEHERTMIESMLKFHDAQVSEVMTPRTEMVCMDASLSVEQAIPRVLECGHSRVPVYRANIDNIIGVLYVKDLLRYDTEELKGRTSLDGVIRKVYFVPETKKISELLTEFRAQRFHIAVILDEYGGTSGLVTIEDILEEIVGEIEDEYDRAALSMIQKVDDVTFDVDGRAHVDEVSEALGVEIPDSDDYETISGFLFVAFGRVPREGDSIDCENLQFHITAADERKIRHIRVQVLHPQGQDSE